ESPLSRERRVQREERRHEGALRRAGLEHPRGDGPRPTHEASEEAGWLLHVARARVARAAGLQPRRDGRPDGGTRRRRERGCGCPRSREARRARTMSVSRRPKLVGVLHLPPLPGSPRSVRSSDDIARAAAEEARILADVGYDAVIVEN